MLVTAPAMNARLASATTGLLGLIQFAKSKAPTRHKQLCVKPSPTSADRWHSNLEQLIPVEAQAATMTAVHSCAPQASKVEVWV